MPGPADTYVAYGRLGHRLQHALSRIQTLGPRRRNQHTADCSLARRYRRSRRTAALPGHLIDIAATCCDVAGATVPDGGQPLEGVTLLPAFAGQPLQREAIYWEHEGNRAVRAGRWKLVAKHDQPWELYDIDTDRVEANNLADKQPDRVRELSLLYDRWAARASSVPLAIAGTPLIPLTTFLTGILTCWQLLCESRF